MRIVSLFAQRREVHVSSNIPLHSWQRPAKLHFRRCLGHKASQFACTSRPVGAPHIGGRKASAKLATPTTHRRAAVSQMHPTQHPASAACRCAFSLQSRSNSPTMPGAQRGAPNWPCAQQNTCLRHFYPHRPAQGTEKQKKWIPTAPHNHCHHCTYTNEKLQTRLRMSLLPNQESAGDKSTPNAVTVSRDVVTVATRNRREQLSIIPCLRNDCRHCNTSATELSISALQYALQTWLACRHG